MTTITIERYKCEKCGREYDQKKKAQECEFSHQNPYSIGDEVVFTYFELEYDGHDRDPSRNIYHKIGKVIQIEGELCLIETKNGSRQWCSKNSLELKSEYDKKGEVNKGEVKNIYRGVST